MTIHEKTRSGKNLKAKRLKKWILGTFLVVLLLTGSIFGYIYSKLNNTVNEMYKPIERETSNVLKEEKPDFVKTFLILGADKRGEDKGRTDGIIVLIMNNKQNTISMLSIPRDTHVNIAGTNKKDKINAAYPLRGVPGILSTVENFIEIPIDNYVLVNMEGFVKAIDAIGGIRLNVDHQAAVGVKRQFGHAPLPEGNVKLTGEQALVFSRFRYDNKGDFGRNERQQQVIKAFIDQSKSIRSPLKINGVLDAIGNDTEMDISKGDLYDLAKKLNNFSSENVEQIKYNATTGTVDGISYVFISEEEQNRVNEILKQKLE